jgi:hypothetical protein
MQLQLFRQRGTQRLVVVYHQNALAGHLASPSDSDPDCLPPPGMAPYRRHFIEFLGRWP